MKSVGFVFFNVVLQWFLHYVVIHKKSFADRGAYGIGHCKTVAFVCFYCPLIIFVYSQQDIAEAEFAALFLCVVEHLLTDSPAVESGHQIYFVQFCRAGSPGVSGVRYISGRFIIYTDNFKMHPGIKFFLQDIR